MSETSAVHLNVGSGLPGLHLATLALRDPRGFGCQKVVLRSRVTVIKPPSGGVGEKPWIHDDQCPIFPVLPVMRLERGSFGYARRSALFTSPSSNQMLEASNRAFPRFPPGWICRSWPPYPEGRADSEPSLELKCLRVTHPKLIVEKNRPNSLVRLIANKQYQPFLRARWCYRNRIHYPDSP